MGSRRLLVRYPAQLCLSLLTITLLSFFSIIAALLVSSAVENLLIYIAMVLAGLFALYLSSSSPVWQWRWWQWPLFLLCLLTGFGLSMFFIESHAIGGMFVFVIYRGFPFAWLQQEKFFETYPSDKVVQQLIAHPEQLATTILWHDFMLALFFYAHLAIILSTFCGRTQRSLMARRSTNQENI